MITTDLVAQIPLFAALSPDRQHQIAARAADVRLQPGEWLIREGELPSFFVLLEGTLDVAKTVASSEQVINRYQPGDFFGELPLLLGSAAVASLRAREVVRVLRLSPTDFRALVVGSPELSGELLRTMAARVGHLQQVAVEAPLATVRIVGPRQDPSSLTMREFLARNHVAFEWLEPGNAEAGYLGIDPTASPAVPRVVLHDGSALAAPSVRILAERLGLPTTPRENLYDLAIVGGGPAGLGAAVYGASEGLRTVLIERYAPGGQAGASSRIENYLGFPSGISGEELSARAWQQARRFGVEILIAREVTSIEPEGLERVVQLDGGQRLRCRALVLTPGVSWRRLGVPGLDRLIGRGVYYGAAQTEALATRGQDVFLIGGGNSAGQAAMFFANYARTVTLLVRRDSLEATM
jgi:thioredoxin reductase (NADPH)